jgi:hypothetical protein
MWPAGNVKTEITRQQAGEKNVADQAVPHD